MTTRKTSVTIDEDLLAEARDVLHTETVRETIHLALLEVVRARARREEIEALQTMENSDLDDDEVMAGAWRE
ncbi:MAG: type II toxin-antitoxin system VapB family antitoxin [Bradymonadaceae bacterium]